MNTSFLVAAGLGLLGFIEPCTVGSHLLFLGRIQGEPIRRKVAITSAFITARVLTTGVIGAIAAVLGQLLIGFQTTVWLLFGILYLGLGLIFLSAQSSRSQEAIGNRACFMAVGEKSDCFGYCVWPQHSSLRRTYHFWVTQSGSKQ